MDHLLPAMVFLPMAAAPVSYMIGRKSKPARNAFACAVQALSLLPALLLLVRALSGAEAPSFFLEGFCGMGLRFRADGFRSLYAAVASCMWCFTGLFSPEYFAHYRNRNRYTFFCLLTLGATLGVFLSDDLYTTFIFFEIMSFTSYTWVAHEETEGALRAAGTYLAVAVIGGMVTLMGLFMIWRELGTLSFEGMALACESRTDLSRLYLPCAFVLFGFGAKAGMFPLHIWLPKAHPVAPAPSSALLSGILTKTGIFGVLVVSLYIFRNDPAWGMALLALGCITMFLGAVLALFSVDLKRTLACSSMSQVGFILVGVACQCLLGEESTLAAQGTVLHMLNHSLFKLVLFMCAGTVYMHLHKLDLNDIRGWGRKKPFLAACFLIAALGISGVPLFSGYISKSLLHEGLLEYVHEGGAFSAVAGVVEKVFIVTGGLTLTYMTKLFTALFIQKHPEKQSQFDKTRPFLSPLGHVALFVPACLLLFMGITPAFSMQALSFLSLPFMDATPHAVDYFSAENLLGALKSVLVAALVYPVVVRGWMTVKKGKTRVYVDRWFKKFDLENTVYRPFIGLLLRLLGLLASGADRFLEGAVLPALRFLLGSLARFADRLLEDAVLPALVGVSGFFARAADRATDRAILPALNAVGTFLGRLFDSLVDALALGAKDRVFSLKRPPLNPTVGNRFTYAVGSFLDRCSAFLNRTVLKSHPIRVRFVPALAAAREDAEENVKHFTRTLSFSLLLFALGLLAVLISIRIF